MIIDSIIMMIYVSVSYSMVIMIVITSILRLAIMSGVAGGQPLRRGGQ